MRISVVIPAFNRVTTLPRALQSVFEQSSPADEVIVVDDGSTDGCALLVESEFPQVRLLQQSNQGVSAARNRGIEAAQYEWIALLDSDDCWLPQKLERMRAVAAQNPEYLLYHCDEIWIRNGKRVNPMNKHRKCGGWIFRQCLPLCAISPSAAIMRKSLLLELGLFDETLPACEDYDLWLRLCHRYPVHFTDEALLVKYGGHADQLSRKYPAMDRFRVRALDRLLASPTLDVEDYEAARDVLLAKLDILLKGAHKHGNQALVDEFEPLQQHWRESAQVPTC